ncbi:MAG: hypothetical protein ABR538_03275 [Candidatus Binatia bacterium]
MNDRRTDLLLAAAVFLGAAAYFASFQPWTRPVILDAATWDYMAVETSRGLVPYRDVFLHKTPGAALLGAAGAAVGSAMGAEPVLAAHALFLLLGALAPVLMFLLCRASALPRAAALAVAVSLLAFDEWPIAALEGCRPKVPTVVFGLAALLAAERRAALAASFFGGVSVLCWQPGLAFLLGAWVVLVKNGERSPRRLVAMAAAAMVPAALLLAGLGLAGALGDFFEQAVLFNLHYIEDKARTPFGTLKALARSLGNWNQVELLLAPAAVAGLWLGRRARPGAFPLSLAVSGAIYTAMTFVSFQSWPDAILLGPIVAGILGIGLHGLLAAGLAPRVAATLALVVLALAALPDDKPKFHPSVGFEVQRARFLAVAEGLRPDDTVVGVSVPEFFLHSGRRNGWKWPYLWFGVDDFAADHHPAGFRGILEDLEADPPAMILVARLWAGPQRALFEAWAARLYDVRTERVFPHLRRPLRVYTLKSRAAARQETRDRYRLRSAQPVPVPGFQ